MKHLEESRSYADGQVACSKFLDSLLMHMNNLTYFLILLGGYRFAEVSKGLMDFMIYCV